MPERDPADFRPAPPNNLKAALVVALLSLIAAVLVWWWMGPSLKPEPPPVPVAQAPAIEAAPAPAPSAPDAVEPQHPLDPLEPPGQSLPGLHESDTYVLEALNALLGQARVASLLQIDGFVHRFVATLDNLPRQRAPSRLWPVHPMPQRFTVQGPEDAELQTIAKANAARYGSFVGFVESVPLDAVYTLYVQLYPLFQSAYEELGYPRQYFNDRMVVVLDHLLATPEPKAALQVKLTQVQGEVPSTHPWLRYEFADPELQALSSGQKIMLRMGVGNARRLKAVLTQWRERIATGELQRSGAGSAA